MQEAVPVNVGAMAAVLGAEVDLINEVINKNKIRGNAYKPTKYMSDLINKFIKEAK